MAYPVALTTLLTRTRRRADIESATDRFPDAEVIDNINGSVARWYDLVRGTTWGGQYFRKTQSINTAAGTNLYALAADFLAVISVDIYVTSTQAISARPYPEEMRNAFRSFPSGTLLTWPGYYQIQGNNLAFQPTPPGAYLVNVNYEPTAPVLDLVTVTSLDSINGWDEWIVLDAAYKCLTKDGDASATERQMLAGERANEEQRIRSHAGDRDKGAAECIHDVTTDYDGWPWSVG